MIIVRILFLVIPCACLDVIATYPQTPCVMQNGHGESAMTSGSFGKYCMNSFDDETAEYCSHGLLLLNKI